MPSAVKKAIIILVAAFAAFYIFTQPEETAAVIKGFFSGVLRLFRALGS